MARKDTKKEKRAEQSRNKARKSRRKLMVWIVFLALLGAGGGWMAFRQSNKPGESIESMGRLHIPRNTPSPKYNSSPPTSGPHSSPARWGEHNQEVPEISQVHNLEHGGVLIQYNCARLPAGQNCGDLRFALRAIMRKARDANGRKFVLAPYGKMPHAIAITAWTWRQTFETPDEAGLLAFADAHYNNAPEDVP